MSQPDQNRHQSGRSNKYGYGLQCECGHLADDHVRLPDHPDGATECYGSKNCECGRFITAQGRAS